MDELDVLVIGTGFCGSIVAGNLARSGLAFKVIEPSSHKDSVDIRWTQDSTFSKDKFLQTAGLGGGSSIWGKALSFASDKNWFIPRGNSNWEEIFEKIGSIVLPVELNLPSPRRRSSRFVSRFFPNLAEEYLEEVGGYAGKKLGKSNKFNLPVINQQDLLECTVLGIKKNGRIFQVSCRDLSGDIFLLRSRVVVLASGAVMNACFYNLATGVKRYPISNHFGAEMGGITLRKPVLVRDGVQTYSDGESEFSTFARKKSSLSWSNLPNSAIRLQADPLHLSKQDVLDCLKYFKVRQFFIYVIPGLIAKYFNFRLVNRIAIRIVVDQRINEENFLTIDGFNDGVFCATIRIQISESVERDAYVFLSQFVGHLKGSQIVGSVELRSPEQVSWVDTAHYFGSTPIGKPDFDSSLTAQCESEVLKGLFVVGNSTFPEGSHGHPTLLSMQLTQLVAEYIISFIGSTD